jgi:hypothetical protein
MGAMQFEMTIPTIINRENWKNCNNNNTTRQDDDKTATTTTTTMLLKEAYTNSYFPVPIKRW